MTHSDNTLVARISIVSDKTMENVPGEKFCLRWNEFEKNISTSFKELREDKDFFDVTLVCDNNQIQAHKVILSACSSFFRTILKQNPHQHPLLYLKGIQYEDITSVLNFMYHGEVNVAQEELNTFLAVAEDLKVKGLIQNNQEEPEEYPAVPTEKKPLSKRVDKVSIPRYRMQPKLRHGYENVSGHQESVEIRNPLPEVKTEPQAPVEIVDEASNQMVVSNDYQDDNSGYEEYQHEYEDQEQDQYGMNVQSHHEKGSYQGNTLSREYNHCLIILF